MTDETIVAVYDTAAHAEGAVAALKQAGIPDSAISQQAGTSTATRAPEATSRREKGFWSSLFGGEPDHDTAVYDRSLADGSIIVSVKAPQTQITRVIQILESHNPIDIDERATGYGLTQTTREGLASSTPTMAVGTAANGEAIQLSEESLAVGKRVVNRGGTRIRRFVVETPVEQTVTLHREKVTVERRPVTDARPVASADWSDKTIEMMETDEEAVISKTARVVEEVGLRKEAAERVEVVRDTVRKEQVDIEQIPGGAGTIASGIATSPRAPKR